jgi:hypothetical protein
MRAAAAEARGSMTNIAVTMNTANRICIAYCSDAIIAPTCIVPFVDPMAAEPEDRDAGEVQHQDQRRHQERESGGSWQSRCWSGRGCAWSNRSR